MNFKNEFTIKNINIPGGEFVKQFEKLLRSSVHYTTLYIIMLYDKYYELKEDITPLKTELISDDIKEKIKYYDIQMKFYNQFIKELNKIQALEINSQSFNDRLEVMIEFNKLIDGWMLKEPGL